MPEEKKEEAREVCEKCGATYAPGAPHAQFCRGSIPEDAECVQCGTRDRDMLKECRSCGEIICECCEEDGTHVC